MMVCRQALSGPDDFDTSILSSNMKTSDLEWLGGGGSHSPLGHNLSNFNALWK